MSTVGALALFSGGARGASPLPGVTITDAKPVVVFLVDRSGSMVQCDGGSFNPVPGGDITLFNPVSDATDDGNCDTDLSDDTPTYTDSYSTVRTNASPYTPYTMSRLEAVKLAIGRVLDANNNGTVDAADEGLLNIAVGVAAFPHSSLTYRTTMVSPVGTSFASVWASVKTITQEGGTPSGPALVGARALLVAPCHDGNPATLCNLDGDADFDDDDAAITCRPYYVVLLTDGKPEFADYTYAGTCPIANDPIARAANLRLRQTVASSAEPATGQGSPGDGPGMGVRTIAIGVSSGMTTLGSQQRGVVNCVGYQGSDASDASSDADKDGDGDWATMKATAVSAETAVGTACASLTNAYAGGNTHVRGLGNGFPGDDADAVTLALDQIFSSVSSGVFSGAEPTFTVNAGGVAAGNAVFSASYDVLPTRVERTGHLRKYRFDTTGLGFVNCDTGSGPGTTPCWDAGGVMVVSTAGFVVRNEVALGDSNDATYSTPGAQPIDYLGGLAERNWLTRRVFAPNPAAMTGTNYEDDESADATRRPDAGGSARTVANMIPSLSPLPVSPTPANLTSLLSGAALTNLQTWLAWGSTQAAIAGYVDTVDTYDASSYASIPVGVVQSSGSAFMLLAGRPTATFNDGTQRCGTCASDDVFSPKFGYPNHSRPVVVGPPAGFTTNVTYTGVSGVDDSGFLETVLTNPYTGSEAVIEREEAYSYGGSYNPAAEVIANPCGEGFAGTCKVKLRRKVIYIGGNDGAVHAFDDKTGHELWAFVPPGMLRKAKDMRAGGAVTLLDGSATVRDVLFSTVGGERTGDGLWHTIMVYSVGLGGRFYFALDVTNPVDPKFLWEFHDSELGNTVARPAIAEIRDHGTLDNNDPGTDIIATSGALPTGETRARTLYTINPRHGAKLDEAVIPVADLATGETAVDIANALTGEPRAVDVDFDGKTDRVYFGDLEGRMWKACDFAEHGQIGAVKLFFDPALYDNPNANSPGYPDTPGTDGGDATPLGGAAAADALQRQQLRGPIYFPADVTHDGAGGLLVAFGSGNIMDVLTPPGAYKNLLWVVKDDTLPASCAPPMASSCAGNTGLNTVTIATPAARTFDNVLLIDELLTGAPQILSGFLVYSEFKRTSTATCGGSSYLSRVNARDVFNCGVPSSTAFSDPVTNTPNVITYTDTLVTGLQVDPSSGNLFIQTSTGTAPPNAVNAPGLQSQTVTVGFRQVY